MEDIAWAVENEVRLKKAVDGCGRGAPQYRTLKALFFYGIRLSLVGELANSWTTFLRLRRRMAEVDKDRHTLIMAVSEARLKGDSDR